MVWQEKAKSLQKEFSFSSFSEALAFVNKVGKLAEQLNHHPDIFLHSYNKVTLTLQTHSAGNEVTQKDRKLAQAIENLLSK